MSEGNHILVVEDDKAISNILRFQLEREGYKISCVYNGVDALEILKEAKIDLILLDWMLPKMNGVDVCRILKKNYSLPVIFLTSKNKVNHIVEGLEAGGDDYIVKPFNFIEVLARVKANIRKYKKEETLLLEWKEISINKIENTVFYSGKRVILNNIEFLILKLFLENPRSIISKNKIIHKIWGYEYDEFTKGNSLEVRVNSLRNKLSPNDRQKYIKTHRNLGYELI